MALDRAGQKSRIPFYETFQGFEVCFLFHVETKMRPFKICHSSPPHTHKHIPEVRKSTAPQNRLGVRALTWDGEDPYSSHCSALNHPVNQISPAEAGLFYITHLIFIGLVNNTNCIAHW